MARSDLLLSLVKAATSGDRPLVRKTVEALAAEERAKNHLVLAEELERQIQNNGSARGEILPLRNTAAPDVLLEMAPRRTLDDMFLSSENRRAVDELVMEHHRADLLRSYNLEPRNRILLTGPPGNGKTSLAEAIASSIMVPLIAARYDALITSFLGETATRLRKLFEYARTRRCVLFFDEFDTLGKERGDIHETGEIKRVVSSLLLQVDDLPAHVVVICATNHPELLDRAVWRRFQLRLELGAPNAAEAGAFVERLARRMNLEPGGSSRRAGSKLAGASFAEIEEFMADVGRSYVLGLPGSNVPAIMAAKLARLRVRKDTRGNRRSR